MADLHWWKLEIDASGKVVSCTAVQRAAAGGRSFVNVPATDAKAAERPREG